MNINLSDLLNNANARAAEAAHTAHTCPPAYAVPAPIPPTASTRQAEPAPLPAASAGGGRQSPKQPKRTAPAESTRREKKITLMATDAEYEIMSLRAKAAHCSLSSYIRQTALHDKAHQDRVDDQRMASLAMMGLLRAELTRCRIALQRREGKDQELIDIMLSIHRMIAIIDEREGELST